jgi:hypothetical protein
MATMGSPNERRLAIFYWHLDASSCRLLLNAFSEVALREPFGRPSGLPDFLKWPPPLFSHCIFSRHRTCILRSMSGREAPAIVVRKAGTVQLLADRGETHTRPQGIRASRRRQLCSMKLRRKPVSGHQSLGRFSRPDALEEIGEGLRPIPCHGSLWCGSPSLPKITVRRG